MQNHPGCVTGAGVRLKRACCCYGLNSMVNTEYEIVQMTTITTGGWVPLTLTRFYNEYM